MAFNFEYPYVDPDRYNADWLIHKMKELAAEMESIEEWKTEYEEAYEEFKAFIDQLESGVLPDSIINALSDWMRRNAYDLIGAMVKNVFFGLTLDGYFVAYIPESWSDIIFSTSGYDDMIAGVDLGHLVLSY